MGALSVPDLLEPEDAAIEPDRCGKIWDTDGDAVDDAVVYIGPNGDVNVDLLEVAIDDDVEEDTVLRKTRAGGNWLIGGIGNKLLVTNFQILGRSREGRIFSNCSKSTYIW
jgi:hypothetical protein